MQNQDPTAQTDPNEYINQLVQINSLEQLISINQNLATVLGAASSPTTPTTPTSPTVPAKGLKPVSQPPTTIGRLRHTPPASSIGSGLSSKPTSNASVKAAGSAGHGNLTPPQISPASRTVARALDGHRAPGLQSHGFRDIPTH
jgi:flagellar basal-body rod modification protein FlgD